MSDLDAKVHDTLATMNDQQRQAYSIGLSHAFDEMFSVMTAAFAKSQDLSDVRKTLSDTWDYVQAVQVVRGVL